MLQLDLTENEIRLVTDALHLLLDKTNERLDKRFDEIGSIYRPLGKKRVDIINSLLNRLAKYE